MDTVDDKCLSQVTGFTKGTRLVLFLNPLENTVIVPLLFLPELFLVKTLKCFLTFLYFNKKIDFLNRCVVVVGLCTLLKI